MRSGSVAPASWWHSRAARVVALAATGLLFTSAGALGAYHYVENYWLYRGYDPPTDPAFVHATGTVQRIFVKSPALGGRTQPVDVYLPPGYDVAKGERYPVFYLLHGVPGRPGAFLQTVRMGVVEDVLLARHTARPMILVMPFGSTGSFTDKEWANGARPHENWETFVSRDLVDAVDHRYRTIRSGDGRVLGGLSEGGYGALNIGLHHPGEFRVLESWSGYERADDVAAIFEHRASLLRWNSPSLVLARRAPALRARHVYVWFYTASGDRLRAENVRFAAQLRMLRVPHRFNVLHGGHDWSLWRGQAGDALLAASRHLGGADA